MGHQQRRNTFTAAAGKAVITSPFDRAILKAPGLVSWWRFDRVIAAAPWSVANMVDGGEALTQVAGYENVALVSGKLVPGGTIRQVGRFAGTAVMTHTMIANASWSKFIIATPTPKTCWPTVDLAGVAQQISRSGSTTTGHWMRFLSTDKVQASVGTAYGTLTASADFTPGAPNWILNAFNNGTKKLSIECCGQGYTEATGTTEENTATVGYVGGSLTGGAYNGDIADFMIWSVPLHDSGYVSTRDLLTEYGAWRAGRANIGMSFAMPGLSAEAAQFKARIAASAWRDEYATLIDGLVKAALWRKLITLHLPGADAATTLTNIKSASFAATAVGTPTFTAFVGYDAGAGKYIDPGFNPTTAGTAFLRNNACAFAWSNTAAQSAGALIGSKTNVAGAPAAVIFPRYVDNFAYTTSANSTQLTTASTDGSGLWMLSRLGAAGYNIYRNGALFANKAAVSAALQNTSIVFMLHQAGAANYYTGQWAGGGFAAGLTAVEQAQLYSLLNTFKLAVTP